MKTQLKKNILDFIKSHNDGSNQAKDLILILEREVNYVDFDCFSICPDDLDKILK